MPRVITELPDELRAACKNEPIDPDWPIQNPVDAINLLYEWDELEGRPELLLSDQVFNITHSHHQEREDLNRLGVDKLYKQSIFTKCVSIGWHLAGRYTYDDELIRILSGLNWKLGGRRPRMVDFGAAPWIQSIFYANKGFNVVAINQSIDSDTHRFGRFLAEKNGFTKNGEKWVKGGGSIEEYSSDDLNWTTQQFDIVYAVDVFEHIPPESDGSPGWIKYADTLFNCLTVGGIWFVNAPFEMDKGPIKSVESHPVHFTCPFTIQEWNEKKGLVHEQFGHYLWHTKGAQGAL